MDKKALLDYALFARKELETQIALSLNKLGIYKDHITKANIVGDVTVIEGTQETYPKRVYDLRNKIIENEVELKGEKFESVVEEFAYTWFNRIIAIRFMEVHDYFPHGFRVLTSRDGSYEPEILMNLSYVLDELDLNESVITSLKEQNKIEELYRYVLFKQCNKLSEIFPELFSNDAQYLELLIPNNLLSQDSIIRKITMIPEEDFLNDVEVVGWLYQYYVQSNREEFRKAKVVTKELIPTLSQVFTPDWIVRYMAENSVGRIWLESYPNSSLKKSMKYYVEDAKQDDETFRKLEQIKYKNVNPGNIKIIEPCCGSGHILVYVFDLLYKMYLEQGYNSKDIPGLILKNNLFGLDIDKRAAQLAHFSLVMKARSIDGRFFNKDRFVEPQVYEIIDSSILLETKYKEYMKSLHFSSKSIELTNRLCDTFKASKILGSLIKTDNIDYSELLEDIERCRENERPNVFEQSFYIDGIDCIKYLINIASILSNKYDVVITNPPYLGISNLVEPGKSYLIDNYPDSKSDMFAMFMEVEYVKQNGFRALVNPDSWMFLISFENLRKKIIKNEMIVNMIHLGMGAFDATVQTTSFVLRNSAITSNGVYFRLVNEKDKEAAFLAGGGITTNINGYNALPNRTFAYWISEAAVHNFNKKTLKEVLISRTGMATANNDLFLRFWFEVDKQKECFNATDIINSVYTGKRWFAYNKGGDFRRWYGNNDYVVDWELDGKRVKNNIDPKTKRIRSHNYNGEFSFQEGITWTELSTGLYSARYSTKGFLFDSAGAKAFFEDEIYFKSILGLLNSKVAQFYFDLVAPTLHYKPGDIDKIPLVFEPQNKYDFIVEENINLSMNDWDSFETSWDFKKHPLT